jgi:hypothetical protein
VGGNAEPEETPAPVETPEETKPEETPAQVEAQAPAQEVTPEPQSTAPEGEKAPAPEPLKAEELERLIQENKLLQHKHRSETSRTAALQRKLNEMEARLASLSTSQGKPPTEQAAPATEEGEDPDLAELKRTDPALYRIIKKREEALKSQVMGLQNTLTQELAPLKQTYHQQEVDAEKNRLQQMIPNIADVVRSEAFTTFVDQAPTGVRNLVMSKSADDVVAGMKIYSSWLQENGMLAAPASTEQASETRAPASAVAAERERKLQQAVTVKSPAAPVKKELSQEELFAQSYTQFRKLHGN